MHLVSISKFPRPSSGIHFRVPKFSLRLSAIFCMYLHVSLFRFRVQASPLISQQLYTYLRSSCFNIELSLSPICPSISCIHFASYVDLPHWPLHHFLRFHSFNTGTSPTSATSCMHLVSASKFPPPCARSKKTRTGSKKEGAKIQKHPAQCERL